jgi:hypothetical protein
MLLNCEIFAAHLPLIIKMKTIIGRYNFDGVWHFTDRSNLDSIKEHKGLLSLRELERRGITIPAPGGNEWSHDADRMKGVHEYVHLAFIDDHPMLYRAKQDGRIPAPIWLKIDASVLLQDGVRFCSEVSNKSGATILAAAEAIRQVDFDVLFTYMDWRNPEIQARRQAALKSEILVPDFIPIEKILGIKNG